MTAAVVAQQSISSHPVSRKRPRITVVLLSRGEENALERAVTLLRDAVGAMNAELLIVRDDESLLPSDRERMTRLAHNARCLVAFAPSGGSRHALADAAMALATGDIIALRDDVAVTDADWLRPFAQALDRGPRQLADREVTPVALVD